MKKNYITPLTSIHTLSVQQTILSGSEDPASYNYSLKTHHQSSDEYINDSEEIL